MASPNASAAPICRPSSSTCARNRSASPFRGRRPTSSTRKASAKEVETVIYELAGVREVAVIGVPEPILGQAIKAIVVAEDGITERDIIRHCAARLEEFMVPSLVEFRSHLPKSENGKIARKE